MTRRRRVALAAIGALFSALAVHTGWGRGERPFEEATGWREIPEELRPTREVPWPAGAGPAPRLRWLGHAGLVVDWMGVRLLFDPCLSARVTIVRRELEIPIRPERLGTIDAVLVSHAHFDHLDRPTIERLPRVDVLLLPAGSEPFVAGWRADAAVVGLAADQLHRVGPLEIVAVPAFHHGNRFHPLASSRRAIGYVVRVAGAGGGALYVAGDSGIANDFRAIGERFRPVVAVLPIGAFSPAWPIGRVHLSPEQAIEAAHALGDPVVVPYHFGTYTLALDRPGTALPRFAHAARAAGLRWALPLLARAEEGS